MKRSFLSLTIFFLRWMLRLRYRIIYKGFEQKIPPGTLFLSNHPAILLDGLIVALPLLQKCQVRPLITQEAFYSSMASKLFRWIHALSVPNFGTGTNSVKLYRLEKTLKAVSQGLRDGESFLIYPAGMTKQTGQEVLGGSFAVYDILQTVPEASIGMVRIVGLWGSRFSRAQHQGEAVHWKNTLKQSLGDVLKAAIFFLPRRRVEVTLELAQDFPKQASKMQMNRWMQEWFNAPFPEKKEPLFLVSYSPWKQVFPVIEDQQKEALLHVRPEVQEAVCSWLAECVKKPKEHIALGDHLIADLGVDSLSLAELITYLQLKFKAPQIIPEDLSTVASVCLAVEASAKPKEPVLQYSNKGSWLRRRKHRRCEISTITTLPDQFFDTADRNLFSCALFDRVKGPSSYRALKEAILVLAYHIQKNMKGKRVGILLPNTPVAHVLVFACQIAGKTPLMLNWTVGSKHLESVVDLSQLQSVITSLAFVDVLDHVDLSSLHDKLVYLEEMKASFDFWPSLFLKMLSFLPSLCAKHSSLFPYWQILKKEDEAVLLFTSGTEREPKGVPLTHENILFNLSDALQVLEISTNDRLMSILPPFHSFGFSVTGIMPLLIGLRVSYFPNPTDAGAIADLMRDLKMTLICSAPSFLKNILYNATDKPLVDTRLMVTGAEKTPPELFALAGQSAPQARVVEGYGITECAPILTVNVQANPSEGVGKPLAHVRLTIVDPDHFEHERAVGQDGLILATGPNIFSGYLQTYVPSPFYDKEGVRWYITGDLGHVTEKGSLVITGRMKRFIKIGGEMVGLNAVEDSLKELFVSNDDEGPAFAVIAIEELTTSPKLVLFAKKQISESVVNETLRSRGFSNLVRIDRVKIIPQIPLTGVGKVSLHALERLVSISEK